MLASAIRFRQPHIKHRNDLSMDTVAASVTHRNENSEEQNQVVLLSDAFMLSSSYQVNYQTASFPKTYHDAHVNRMLGASPVHFHSRERDLARVRELESAKDRIDLMRYAMLEGCLMPQSVWLISDAYRYDRERCNSLTRTLLTQLQHVLTRRLFDGVKLLHHDRPLVYEFLQKHEGQDMDKGYYVVVCLDARPIWSRERAWPIQLKCAKGFDHQVRMRPGDALFITDEMQWSFPAMKGHEDVLMGVFEFMKVER